MFVLKYICFIIAVVTTGLYINNLIVDFTRAMTWGKTVTFGSEEAEKGRQQEPDDYTMFRFALSIIMGITWGVVFLV